MAFRLLYFCFIFLAAASSVAAQVRNAQTLIADAVWFRGTADSANRLDVYLAVPYSSLQFVKSADNYIAEYEAVITLRDSTGRKIRQQNLTRRCIAPDYEASRGINGAADYSQTVFYLSSGKVNAEIIATDAVAKRNIGISLTVLIPQYRSKLFEMSGLLTVSSIEEHNGKYIITPYISTIVSRLTESFFIFFETYNNTSDVEEADFIYEILDAKGISVQRGERTKQNTKGDVTQHYLPVPPQKSRPAGNYSLRVIMLKTGDKTASYSTADILSVSLRPIVIERSAADAAGKDLDKLIRQMMYVASQSEIDNIEDAELPDEKRRLFDEFWQKLDPTPGTERNEAFEEYYGRVEYANQNFRTFREGWLSDMGAVYVVFGPPVNIERTPPVPANGRNIVRWTMADNRRFTFIDDMGFGEYRLAPAVQIAEKYHYKN
ncbi:hypothetical protein MASR2M18_13280 [Ignavibacteria bacterium]|nr:GWxTD domain-containing protein [Bacteroidota bacterium]MCZ2132301.1 GWxTD domain-containing protein [Bacteroidota bacterium]